MKVETFFQKIGELVDAPGAVARIRELVLAWAVRGKLCHADVVPWRETSLGDVITLISGQHLLADEHNTDGRGIPYLTGPSDFSEKHPIATRWTEQPKVTAEPGDILITVKGAGVGKTNVLIDQTTAISRQLMAIRVTGADPDFVHIVVKLAAEHFQEAMTGIAIPGIGREDVLSLKLVLPPLAEQKRIVAKVDELMALCDRLEAQLQERETRQAALARAALARFADAPTPANLKLLFHDSFTITPADLRKTILTLAVQGHLVPQDPTDEPSETLLDRIEKQKRRLHESDALRATKPCRELSPEEAPHAIPDSWAWTMLGEVTDIGTGSTPSRTQPAYWSDGSIPWVTSGSTSCRIISSGDEFVTPAGVKAHRLRLYPAGTLLVALYGQGKTRGQVAVLGISATINQACAAICPLEGLPSMQGYLQLLLEKQYDEVRMLAAGGAQPNLNVQKIKELLVPLPPLAEQRRIVAKVDQLMALVDQWEAQLAAARTTADRLLSALVAELTAA
jgi:type I restriction enzyme S subunit